MAHCIKICSQYFFQIIRSEYQKRGDSHLEGLTKNILEFTPTNFAHEIPTTGLPNFTFQIINDLVYHVHVLLLPTGDPTSLTFKKKQRKKPQSCNFGQNPLMETWDVRGLGIATSEISDELFVGPKASVPGRVGSPANNMDISKNRYSPLRWTRNNKKWQTIYNLSQYITMHFLSSFSEFNQKLACNIGLVTVKVPFGDLPAFCKPMFSTRHFASLFDLCLSSCKTNIWDNL